MIKIKFYSSFSDSKKTSENFIRVNELENTQEYGRDYIFTTKDDYTHVIILNTAMPVLNIPKENVIGLAFEPIKFLNLSHNFINYATKNIGLYLIGEKQNLPEPFIEHHGYMWHTPFKKNNTKTKKISIMVSGKKNAPGHTYRHTLVKEILKSNLEIDIWGRGCTNYMYTRDKRLKGVFKETEYLDDYEYHICIENFQTPHYFSEKIMNSLICNSVPIYFGCLNVKSYFGNCILNLTGNVKEDMNMFEDIIKNKRDIEINMERVKETININNLIKDKFLNK